MHVLTFVCKSIKKGTNPCREGGVVAEKLGVPQGQQEHFCGEFVEKMPRTRGIPKFHTCIRQLGDAGRMFVTQDEPDTMRIEVRMKAPFDARSAYDAIRYLEGRHTATTWRFEDEGGGDPVVLPMVAGMMPPMVAEPPPRVEEEPTAERLEPRPCGVKPEDVPARAYRGPVAGTPSGG